MTDFYSIVNIIYSSRFRQYRRIAVVRAIQRIAKQCYATKIGVGKNYNKAPLFSLSGSAAMENKYYATPMSWFVV